MRRAIGMLMAAIAAHTWLVRAPQPHRAVDSAPVMASAAPAGAIDRTPPAQDIQPGQQDEDPGAAPLLGDASLPRAPASSSSVAASPAALEAATAPAVAASLARTSAGPVVGTMGARAASYEPVGTSGTAAGAPADTPAAAAADAASQPVEPHKADAALIVGPEPATLLEALELSAHTSTAPVAVPRLPAPPARVPALAEPPRAAAATVVPAARTAEVEGTAELLQQKDSVREVLDRYTRAYGALDVQAAKAVWPTLDARALRRAFNQLDAQTVRFASCGISIKGQDANARCQGEATYRPKVGSRVMHVTEREWMFSLSREAGGWQIVNATIQ